MYLRFLLHRGKVIVDFLQQRLLERIISKRGADGIDQKLSDFVLAQREFVGEEPELTLDVRALDGGNQRFLSVLMG